MRKIDRREFIKELGLIIGAIIGGISSAGELTQRDIDGDIPKRVLGRTGVEVSILALGMGPLGINREIAQKEVDELVNLCIDLGINYIDVAPNYGNGEEKLSNIMKSRRSEVFLVTKVEEQDKEGALKQIHESLKKMQTDHLDAVHLHNFGGFDTDFVLGSNGAFAGLLEAKKSGLIRFIGISGHEKPMTFIKAIETDEIDIVMPVINFVDKHTYNFESVVLPEAAKHKAGVAAMKILGGAVGMQYDKPMPALLPEKYHFDSIRYALGFKEVATIVIGMKNQEEILKAVKAVKNYKPLSEEERQVLDRVGKELAQNWGAHFGPVN
ncbi:MAG: aldo/keto reductase [bacterium]